MRYTISRKGIDHRTEGPREDKELGRKKRMNWKEIAWTKAEIMTLREVWPRESRRVQSLPNRTWSACASMASSLKIRRLKPCEPLDRYQV